MTGVRRKRDLRASHQRCAYLLQRIAAGDHKALANAEAATREAIRLLKASGAVDPWIDKLKVKL